MESKADLLSERRRDKVYRRELQREADHARDMLAQRRELMSNLRGLRSSGRNLVNNVAGVGGRGGMFGLIAGGGLAAAGVSSVRQALTVDKMETSARMNMDQSKLSATDLKKWAMPRAVQLGVDPALLMKSVVESAKAGIPENMARMTAELGIMTAQRFEVDINEMLEGLGRSIAVEMGSGRLSNSPEGMAHIRSYFNMATLLAGQTATKPDEVMSFLRSGIGAGNALGMSEEATFAFGNASIMAGGQGRQSSRFLAHLDKEIAEKTRRQQTIMEKHGRWNPENRAFMELPQQLGYGSYEEILDSFKKDKDNALFNLIKAFKQIKDPFERSQALFDFWGQEFQPIMQQLIDSPGLMDDSLRLAKQAKAQSAETDEIARGWQEYEKGLQFLLGVISSVWKAVKTEVGDSFKPFIDQFSAWAKEWYLAVGTSGLRDRLNKVLQGLTEGFLGRPGTFRDLLNQAFGKPGEGDAGNVDNFFKYAKGFAEGLKSVANFFIDTFKAIGVALGKDLNNPEALAKFAGEIVGLVAALTLLGPLISVFSSVVAILWSLGKVLNFLGASKAFAWLAAKVGLAGAAPVLGGAVMGDGRGNLSNSDGEFEGAVKQLKRLQEERQKKEIEKLKGGADPLFQPTSYRGSTDRLGERMDKFGAKLELASLRGDLGSLSGGGGFQTAFSGGGSSGSSGSGLNILSGAGTPDALLKAVPGQALPNFGVPQSGSIIKRDNIPSFNGGGGSAAGGLNKAAFERTFAGTPLAGKYDEVVSAARAKGIPPALLAGVMAHETGRGNVLSGNNPGGIMDPATGMARKMQFGSLDAGIDRTAAAVAKNYNAAGGNLDAMGQRYAPVGAANDPNGQNAGWSKGVRKYMGDMSADTVGSQVASLNPVAPFGVESGLADRLGIRGGANFMQGQYGGPGQNQTTITTASGKKLTVNAAAAESFKGFVDELEASGYKINSLGGYNLRQKRGGGGWSQHAYGNAIDINPAKNPMTGKLITDMPGNIRDMAAKYGLSWGGDWKSTKDAMHFEWMGKKPWLDNPAGVGGKVPAPAEAIKNVPPVPTGQFQAGLGGGSRGNVAIHINGNSHDPEALATLVQRRVDESMNWRAHDSASEYT
jgi:hypothetical protein